jgi:hypothetical protein
MAHDLLGAEVPIIPSSGATSMAIKRSGHVEDSDWHRPKTEAWRVLWPDTYGSVSYQPDALARVPQILAAEWENPRLRVGLIYARAL